MNKSKRNISEMVVNQIKDILNNSVFVYNNKKHSSFLIQANKGCILSQQLMKGDGKKLVREVEVDSPNEIVLDEFENIFNKTLNLICLIEKQHFTLLIEILPIDLIVSYLTCHYSLMPQLRLNLMKVYTKFLLENNYYISKFLPKLYLSKSISEIDLNLIGRIESNVFISSDINALIKQSEEMKYKEFDYIAENNGFNPILESLKFYVSNKRKYKYYFEDNLDFNLEYFENVILKTTLLSIYKLIFYSKIITADTKYQIYRFIFFFTANCKHFFETMSANDLSILAKKEKIFVTCLRKEEFPTIKSFKDELLDELACDVKDIGDKAFDHLNLELIFCIYFKYLRLFSIYKDLTNGYIYNFQTLVNEMSKNNQDHPQENKESVFGKSGQNFFQQSLKSVSHSRQGSSIIGDSNLYSKKQRNNSGLQEELLYNNQAEESKSKFYPKMTELNIKHKDSAISIIDGKIALVSEVGDKSKISGKKQNVEETDNFYNLLKDGLKEYQEIKEDYFEKNILNDMFLDDNPDLYYVKKTIGMDLFSKLSTTKFDDFNTFPEHNANILEVLNKLFKTEPNIWQQIITESKDAKVFFEFVIKSQLFYTYQFIITDFCRLSFNKEENFHYKQFLNYLEFLRLTCEDHNKIFQTLQINYPVNQQVSLICFIFSVKIQTINYLNTYLEKADLLRFFRSEVKSRDYFNDLTLKLTDYLIEIIQGAINYNFNKISQLPEFHYYVITYYKYFDKLEDKEEFEYSIYQFMRFITCFLEENSNSLENKLKIAKKINPKKLQTLLTYCFKKLHFKLSKNEFVENDENNIKVESNEEGGLFNSNLLNYYFTNEDRFDKAEFVLHHIPHKASEKLIKEYIGNETFYEEPLFNLSICFFMFLKRTSFWRGGEKSLNIINNLKTLSETELDQNEKHISSYNLNKEMFLFYDKLIKDVEISFSIDDTLEESYLRTYKHLFIDSLREHYDQLVENSNNKINVLDTVIFQVHPDTLFVMPMDKDNFIQMAPYDHFNEKLNFFLEYFDTYRNKLLMRKALWETNSTILNSIYLIDYNKMEIISAIFSLIVNLIMLKSVMYRDIVNNVIVFPHLHVAEVIASIHNILLLFLILNWYFFKVYETWKFEEVPQGFWKKIFLLLGLFLKQEIFPFIWNLLFGSLALFSHQKLIFSLQLFMIFNIFPTMSSVLFAVRIRYSQFASTAYMLLILVFMYSAITYYNFSRELKDENGVSIIVFQL